MPLKLREILRKIAPYVKSNYNQLLKCGFSKEEAIVAYNEGAKLFMQAAQHPKTISLGQVKAAQEMSKNEFVTHAKNVHSTTIMTANQSSHKSSKFTAIKVGMEIEI